jgi:hypothetical protein
MSTITNVAFTICSNNYLGQAQALKNSFLRHNPDFQLFIVIVDRPSDLVDYKEFDPASLIFVEDIQEIDLEDLLNRYNIIELNTSLKPTIFKYIINKYSNIDVVYYLDPDLYFYASLNETNQILKEASIVLTPHILSKIPRDGKLPDENVFLNFGIYNLGFIGLNPRHKETLKLLDWWEERTIYHGYINTKRGYFVDQLWLNLAPVFFKDVKILKTYNYNMAPWNLHERYIVRKENDEIILNDDTQLVFYHFSKLASNDVDVSREYNRKTLLDLPQLRDLYREYKNVLKDLNYEKYKAISISFQLNKNNAQKRSLLNRGLKKVAKKLLKIAEKL